MALLWQPAGNITCPETGSPVVPVKFGLSSSWISTWKGERAVHCIHLSKLQGRATSGIRAQQASFPQLSQCPSLEPLGTRPPCAHLILIGREH